MPIEFKDKDGIYGRISDALEVEYYGRFSSKIEKFVTGLEDFSDGDQAFQDEDVMTHIMLELPDTAPVMEVQRAENTR